MGGCVSKPRNKLKSKAKYIYKSCRFRRKIAPSSLVAPLENHHTDDEEEDVYASDFSVQEFVYVDIQNGGTTICRRSEVQSLTFQLPRIQQDDDNNNNNDNVSTDIWEEEQWFECLSVLDSDTDEDFSSVAGGDFRISRYLLSNLPSFILSNLFI